ncbi:lachesin-like isoform X2 [Pectinophora gossypiella]|nr:lachesin-like isoform X2 [Pectinophora gossypiella]
MFSGEGSNVTVVVGRDATLVCTVENLHSYKVAWLRVDTQTILTLGPHVITKNHRVGVARLDPQSWALTVRDVRPSDGGRYMCQINTEPMITQTHILQVSVPPDIEDSSSSGSVLVREGDHVSLHCAASGIPPPAITWRREDNSPITLATHTVGKWSGEWLNMTAVQRDMSGAYLCIATNGVPPSVSKRIMLHVLCKPSVRMSQKMIGGYVGETVTMLCKIETYPVPVVYWTHLEGRLHNGSKYQMSVSSKGYKHEASLRVTELSRDDIGPYSCHAENALGSAWDDITLYTLVTTTFTSTSVETTKHEVISTTVNPHTEKDEERTLKKDFFDEDNFVVVLSQHQMQNLDVSPTS